MLNKVYLIDDDEVTLYLTGLVLTFYAPDCNCVNFEHAPDALAQLKLDLEYDSLPTMILMDLNMPVMNGIQMLEALETIFRDAPAIPMIYILTSSISNADKLNCKKSSLVIDVIEKPLTDKKLEEISYQHSSIPICSRT